MKLNSLQLYTLWHQGPEREMRSEFAKDFAYSRNYYRKLCDAIATEVANEGRCYILDELLRISPPTWDLIVFHAVLEVVRCTVTKQHLTEPDRHVLETFEGSRYLWRNLGPDARLSLTPERRYFMTLIRWFFRHCWERAAGTSDRMVADARAEAERILSNAQQARENLLREAREQAELIEAAAHEKAAGIELNAQRKAQQITMEAQQNAEDCYEQAYEEAREQALVRLEAEAQAESQRLVRQNLTGFMNRQRQQWQSSQAETEQLYQQLSEQTATLKEQACQQTTSAGADVAVMLEDAVNQLNALKNGFFSGLQDWRSSLYKAEYGPLVNCYNNLLMLIAGFDRDVAAEQQRLDGTLSEEELTVLQQHSNKMEKFRNNMERAMLAMGLRVFRPAEGDIFDSYTHATDDDEDDDTYNGCTIARCVRPGIIRTVNSANEEVLHRATVILSRPTDAFDD